MRGDDLETNVKGVIKQAEKKGVANPNVFAVSAMDEQEHKPDSGFVAVRTFIRDNITGGKAPLLKLKNNLKTAQNVSKRIASGLEVLSEQYQMDLAFRTDITETLNEQEAKSKKQVDILVENMIDTYDSISMRTEKELREGLGFFTLLRRTVASVFSKKESSKAWLDDISTRLETDLNTALTEKLKNGVGDIADNIQQMVKIIDLKIRNSKTVLKDNEHIFSDLSERRANVLRDLQSEFAAFINHSENFLDSSMFPEKDNFSPNIATGGGLAAIGVILAAVTQGMVFDITGGVLTVIGLAVSSFTVSSKRKELFEEYEAAISKGKVALSTDITHRLNDYIVTIKDKTDRNFEDFDALLGIEERKVTQYSDKFEDIQGRIDELAEALKS
jgi:hypothetical protein